MGNLTKYIITRYSNKQYLPDYTHQSWRRGGEEYQVGELDHLHLQVLQTVAVWEAGEDK